MATVDILYIILAACVVVITVTLVWLSNELIGLIRSIKRSSLDVETVTKEIREKVLLVSEALDRAGTAASNIIGLVEDAIESIKSKRDQLVNSIGLVTGVGEYARRKKDKNPPAGGRTAGGEKEEETEEEPEEEENPPAGGEKEEEPEEPEEETEENEEGEEKGEEEKVPTTEGVGIPSGSRGKEEEAKKQKIEASEPKEESRKASKPKSKK